MCDRQPQSWADGPGGPHLGGGQPHCSCSCSDLINSLTGSHEIGSHASCSDATCAGGLQEECLVLKALVLVVFRRQAM
jgi:hypothetical protein